MKAILTLFVALFLVGYTYSQSVLRYEFQNSFNEKNGAGPVLTVLGNQGEYVLDTLNEISGNTRTVYRFEKNSGFQFNNSLAGNFIGETYSIELYFEFDELASWKRVVDWKNRKSDHGAYVYYGELNFYPYIYSDDAPVLPGEYTYYVVTRNGATGQVLVYADADEEIDFMDVNGSALVDADNVINFFHDDLSVPNEASAGAVALLNLYNYVLDSNVVKGNFENLGGQVFSVKELSPSKALLKVSPNPASTSVTVNLSGFGDQNVQLSMVNYSGTVVYDELLRTGQTPQVVINTGSFAEGVYLVRATSQKETASYKILIVK